MDSTSPTLPDFDALWDYQQPAVSETRFRELLPAAQASGNADYHAQLLTQIARTQGLQRQFDAAHETLNGVQPMLSDQTPIARVRYLLERGRVYNSARQPEQARPLFLEAWDAARTAGDDNLAVDAAHMMGIIEPLEEQIAWDERALQMAENSEQPEARRWLGSLYNNLAWTYHDLGQYDRALDLFMRAQVWHELYGTPYTIRVARWSIGRALRSFEMLEEALVIQRGLLRELTTSGERDGYVYEELGECLLLKGELDEAAPYFRQAYLELAQDQWLVANEPTRLERLKTLGNG
ncbi:MAG: tetratricopeptide repeat protein [Anaerolineae bacterium]|nr:tetratricopeptide repeat protein [Anaerolineae bacterium]